MTMTLYSAWRATAPYRVRIGLKLKGLDYDYVGVDLLGGEQHKPAYRAINRQRLTPALDLGDGDVMTQSLAILEWLDETHPEPSILPGDARARARIRTMALVIACDVHPLNNTRVGRALEAMDVSPVRRAKWTERWILDGFQTLEPMVAEYGQGFAFGDTPTLADCCLIPQVYSATRFGISLEPFPAILAVATRAAAHPAFMAAHPDLQPDAVHA
ncbi:MAG: maleylacetoacetate isomerase [Alphaproteobacteria bacterium]